MNNHARAEVNRKLTEDFRFYAAKAPLCVKPKIGPVIPLRLNPAQNILHEKIEDQIARTGKVRIIVLKGRQQGVSTYIGGRFYHKTSRQPANNTFIITHLAEATANLYDMTTRYHANVDSRLQTPTVYSSKKGIQFDGIDSNYRIATAGSAEVGRSFTITNFHGSEIAFWPDAEKIAAGALQAVPDMPGTEVIFESTANGMNNDFYVMCDNALKGIGEFELVFIPWFVTPEYRREVPEGFMLTPEEVNIMETYGLDTRQMVWRRNKIDTDFKGKVSKFYQEYPCNPDEAFQANDNSLIDIEKVQKARARTIQDMENFHAPVVMGVDPATRKDRFVMSIRKGLKLITSIVFDCNEQELKPSEVVQEVAAAIEEYKPVKVFVDSGEIGHALIEQLHNLGYKGKVVGVNFGNRASKPDVYENKRAEMWIRMADWFAEDLCSIPDSLEIQKDLMSMPDYFLNTSQKQQLVSKKKLKEDYKASTDIGDSIALTFAFPVKKNQAPAKRVGALNKKKEENKKVTRKSVRF